jgi:hypothetical protein
MRPNRWFGLRHPDGFSPDMFDHFKTQCRIWQTSVENQIAKWDEDVLLKRCEKPDYIFFEPTISQDRQIVTLPIGGEVDYLALKMFEDYFPELYRDFPTPFRFGIELGRYDALFNPDDPGPSWSSMYQLVETIKADEFIPNQQDVTLYIWQDCYKYYDSWFYCWTYSKDGVRSESEDIGPVKLNGKYGLCLISIGGFICKPTW